MSKKTIDDAHDAYVKAASDRGLLVESGWQAFRIFVMAPDAPDIQVREMRLAFFAGAQHLYASMLGMMDPGEEETADDVRRSENLHNELESFAKELGLRVADTKGSS